ncbi:DUF6881 domain-containing protein [Caulobacter endophyticus]|uniref:DUF6881 domain-containing protein n=1 Tax=Caulobacter endophyticus TaxID=2172652 RepID=UPI00240EECFB|nr:hypothetical protein [Caulobacter endophyticus]MDG2530783.1 hypothetical protein [Caulobacter endophyticus]
MSLSYFRCDWAHESAEEPVSIFYEVDDEGRVLRLIDVFRDGSRERDAVANYVGREHELPGEDSLSEDDFHDSVEALLDDEDVVEGEDRLSLTPVEASVFEAAWRLDA